MPSSCATYCSNYYKDVCFSCKSTVYRYHDGSERAYHSNLSNSSLTEEQQLRAKGHAYANKEQFSHEHMRGDTQYSAALSVTKNPTHLHESTDPWAGKIAYKAPYLSEFEVPNSHLHHPRPTNTLSRREEEALFYNYGGNGIKSYETRQDPNPYQGQRPPNVPTNRCRHGHSEGEYCSRCGGTIRFY